jgi:hypothetical protein
MFHDDLDPWNFDCVVAFALAAFALAAFALAAFALAAFALAARNNRFRNIYIDGPGGFNESKKDSRNI